MSAPLAGKFQDHYEVLGLTPRATLEEIQQICQQLMAKYDPVMGTEPDLDQFESVKLALEVLSDADLRAQFDKLKGIEEKPPQFTGMPFFEGLGVDARLRSAMLCVLFDRRRSNPVKPTLTMRQVDRIIDADTDAFILAVWYLKQRGMVTVNDKSHLEITVKGIDELEANPPSPEDVMGLIRPEGLAGYEPPEPEAELPEAQRTEAAEAQAQAEEASGETSTLEAGEPAEEGTESAAEGHVPVEAGLQALAGAVSQDAGASPSPAANEPEPVAAAAGKRFRLSRSEEIHTTPDQGSAQTPATNPCPEILPQNSAEPASSGGEPVAWSVSTPLHDATEAALSDPTQTVGGRLQGILGRPRFR